MPAAATAEALLEQLKDLRVKNVHDPLTVVHVGQQLLERRFAAKRGEQVWTVLEQIGSAAAECGQFDLAEVCASRLDAQFPDSPRVALLLGAIAEAKGQTDAAVAIYNREIKKDATNTAARKRLIAMHLHAPSSNDKGKGVANTTYLSKTKGIDMLVQFLDTFYNDMDAWVQLAEAYQSLQLYSQSLSAISNLILLAPFNPFYLLWHAETAYTVQDFALAYKEFLRVIELTEGVSTKGGIGRRAAIGVKMCLTRLSSSTTNDNTFKPTRQPEIDLLMTKLIIKSYEHRDASMKPEIKEWIGDEPVVR
ncbi:Inositol phosphatase SIW14 [Microbotryomycetes sp. JL201]|nr:Inositol phosphatase SIW14 [Microbotryomycetes sp. JL201]